MPEDKDIEILDDGNENTSPSKSNNKDASRINEAATKNKQAPSTPAGAKGGVNNGNQFKNSGNLGKISGAMNSNDPDEQAQNLKNMGKDAIKPLVRKGVQAATGGAVGSGPVTGKIIDKTVDKLADSEAVEKIIDTTVKAVNKQRKLIRLKALLSLGGAFLPIIGVLVIVLCLFAPVLGIISSNDNKKNKYEQKYYDELDRVSELYDSACNSSYNQNLISTTILYDQVIYNDGKDIEYDLEEDKDITTSAIVKINFRGKADDVETLSKKLYPNFDFSDGADNSGENACEPNYSDYKSNLRTYAINNYTKLGFEVNYDKVVDEIMSLGGYTTYGEEESGPTGNFGQVIVGAGVAGAIPNEVLNVSQSPFGDNSVTLTSCYGFYGVDNCTAHSGVDIVGSGSSAVVYSIADGIVTSVVSSATHCNVDWKNGKACSVCAIAGGNSITIKHTAVKDGNTIEFYSQYFHLQNVMVKVGQEVSKSTAIAVMGNTGCSSGNHLHFNMLSASKQRYNPEELLQYVGIGVSAGCSQARIKCKG